MLSVTSVGRMDTSRVAAGQRKKERTKKEVGRTKHMKRKQKPMKVHELMDMATTAIHDTTKPTCTAGSDSLPHEDSASEQPQ